MFAFFVLSQLQKGQENWPRKAANQPAGWPRQGRIYVALSIYVCVCVCVREGGKPVCSRSVTKISPWLVTFFGAAAKAAADDDDADGDES